MPGYSNLQDQNRVTDTPEVPPASVRTRSIVDGAVTNAKIGAEALAAEKLQGASSVGENGGEVIPATNVFIVDEAFDGDATVTVPFLSGRNFVVKAVRIVIDTPGVPASTATLSASAINVTNALPTSGAAKTVVDADEITTGPHNSSAVVFTRTDDQCHFTAFIDFIYT